MIDERSVETKWGSIRYVELGSGVNVMVFLHGWVGTPAFVLRLAKEFDLEKYRLIAPYMPGHGSSFPLPVDYNFRGLVETIEEFLLKLHLPKFMLIGHSVGGSLAWELAIRNRLKLKLKTVVLVSAFANPRGRLMADVVWSWIIDRVELLRQAVKGEKRLPVNNGSAFGYLVGRPHREYLGFWRVARTVALTRQKDLRIPVYLFWGSEDGIAPLGDFKMATGVESFTERVYPGGHYWFLTYKEEMLSDLKEALRR